MKDIGAELDKTINDMQCSPLYAFLRLSEVKDVRILQSEPLSETRRRLRNKSNFKDDRE